MMNKNSNYYFDLTTNISVFLFFSLALILKSGTKYGAILLVLSAIISAPFLWRKIKLTKESKLICIAFALMAVVDILIGFRIEPKPSEFEQAIKYIVAIFLLIYLLNYPPNPKAIWWGIAFGCIGTGLTAIFYTWVSPELAHHPGRASPYLNPITYGNISVLLAGLALCGINTDDKYLKTILIIAIPFGLFASVLSQTRGAWLTFFLAVIVMAFFFIRNKTNPSRNYIKLIVICLITLCISYQSQVGEMVSDRMSVTIKELSYNLENEKFGDGSIGLRLQMWEFAAHEGFNNPFLGVNKLQIEKDKLHWVQEGNASEAIIKFTHFHNEFLNTFAKKGLIGLSALLLLFSLPIYAYNSIRKAVKKETQTLLNLRVAGIVHIVMFAGFGLTEVSLDVFNIALLMFLLPLCFIYTSYIREAKIFDLKNS